VNQVLIALSVAAGITVGGWLLLSGTRILSQTLLRRSDDSRWSLDSRDVRDAERMSADRAAPERHAPRISSQSGETEELPPQRHEPSQAVNAAGDAEAILSKAVLTAAEILAHAQRERERLLEESLASANRAALEIKGEAERAAEAIVEGAELKAREALIEAEHQRARLEQEMQEVAREQALMAVKHRKLSEFLLTALEEIERTSANGSANIRGLEELRDELHSTE
jgi:hypothetical protein